VSQRSWRKSIDQEFNHAGLIEQAEAWPPPAN
jgi:hypothetical protein